MIKLIPINPTNKELVLNLYIFPTQIHFIESIEQCLKESQELDLWRPVAIYDDEVLIGFAMYGLWENEGTHGRVWLDRFLIDAHFQGQGYGKKALHTLIMHLFDTYSCNEIYLSLYPNNKVARHLYQKAGFVFNGEKDIHNEDVMVLKKVV